MLKGQYGENLDICRASLLPLHMKGFLRTSNRRYTCSLRSLAPPGIAAEMAQAQQMVSLAASTS